MKVIKHDEEFIYVDSAGKETKGYLCFRKFPIFIISSNGVKT